MPTFDLSWYTVFFVLLLLGLGLLVSTLRFTGDRQGPTILLRMRETTTSTKRTACACVLIDVATVGLFAVIAAGVHGWTWVSLLCFAGGVALLGRRLYRVQADVMGHVLRDIFGKDGR